MKKALIWGLLGIVVLAAGAVAWFAPADDAGAEIGNTVPEYSAPNLQGEEVSFEDVRGQVALVSVWATWCGPCRVEMPSIQALYDRYSDEGFTVLAISIDTDPRYERKVREFKEQFDLTFPILLDPANEITRALQTVGVPENFVIDKQGRIVKRVIGASNWDTEANRALIEELLRM